MTKQGPFLRIRQGDYDRLEYKDPATLYQMDPTADPIPPDYGKPEPHDPTPAGYRIRLHAERLIAGGIPEADALQIAKDTERTRAHADYTASAQEDTLRTIRIALPMDAKLYGELLTLITDRWPGSKLAHGGIYIPEEDTP